ncbi:uncharacterized protein BJ171DRAFT_167029 [Polychytrium aggregatum]|uniref:uncharacterized protein n=1 Tax=Polychytrium aggregatum TaxID=110093 RepID=UPI0022FDE2AD|nr:uncharacterized protein BJ171DRAFT_167029 [Polychytrium aggregatum]KAI9202782.1 hypothetical protein BJ171DRAFT_167029 [Polychytrium aggregatum]
MADGQIGFSLKAPALRLSDILLLFVAVPIFLFTVAYLLPPRIKRALLGIFSRLALYGRTSALPLPIHTHTLVQGISPPAISFEEAVRQGLSSDNFNIQTENLDQNDRRHGVQESDAQRIAQIMKDENINFDQARYRFVQQKFRENGIDPDTGLLLDPKALQPSPSRTSP